MFYKILPAACLVASASAFSLAPALTTARTPALASLSSAQNVGGVTSLTTPATSTTVSSTLRKARSDLGLKMSTATPAATSTAAVPLTGNTLKAALKVRMTLVCQVGSASRTLRLLLALD